VRFVRREQGVDALGELEPRGLRLDRRIAGKEIDAADDVELALQAPTQACELGRRERRQASLRRLPRLAQAGVVGAAVEQPAIGGLVAGLRHDHHQPGVAALADALVGEGAQRLFTLAAARQQVGAVAQGDAAGRLEGAPDAHARGRARRGERHDEQVPGVVDDSHVDYHTLM
jgi:hypothetical protein